MIQIVIFLRNQPKSNLMAIGIIGVILIGYANLQAGLEFSASIFYLLPVSLVSWCAGRREGGFIALCSSVSWYVAEFYAGRDYSHPLIYYWNMVVMFGFFFTMSFTLSGLNHAYEKEQKLARSDPLTGVCNSRFFSVLAAREVERCRRYNHPLTLVYLDCDNFKSVNDQFGHQAGNQLLRNLAAAILNNTRSTDIVARMGGDEFAILMPETGEQILPQALDRLKGRLLQALKEAGHPVTLSVGAAIYLYPPESLDEVIRSADRLMFLAKNQGKNTLKYQVFDIPQIDIRSLPNPHPQSPSEPLPSVPVPSARPHGLFPNSPPKTAASPRA